MSTSALVPALVVAFLTLAGCRSEPHAAPSGPAASSPVATVSAPAASSEPDVVSHASVVRDGGPAVMTAAKVDGAALRKRHVARMKKDHSPVTILGGENALELGQRICDEVVPKRPSATPILIKPNICGFDNIKDPQKAGGDDNVRGRTTDPEFVRGIVRCMRARGHTQITVAEG